MIPSNTDPSAPGKPGEPESGWQMIESCTDLDTLNGWFRRSLKVDQARFQILSRAWPAVGENGIAP